MERSRSRAGLGQPSGERQLSPTLAALRPSLSSLDQVHCLHYRDDMQAGNALPPVRCYKQSWGWARSTFSRAESWSKVDIGDDISSKS